MPTPSLRRTLLPLALLCATIGADPGPRRDLDVGVPPGSALDLAAGFASGSPRESGALPHSPGAERPDRERSRSAAARQPAPLPGLNAHAQVRILTWDLAAHLDWVRKPGAPVADSEGAYWITLAPLLRLLLHPEQVTRGETLGHLLQVGPAALPALEAAASEAALRRDCQDLAQRIQAGLGQALPEPDPELSATERMWRGLVNRELLAAAPFDPAAGFGLRLDLYRERIEPRVRALASGPHVELRRASVAYLARTPSPANLEVLGQRAVGAQDGVELLRALDGLCPYGPRISTGALVNRLERSEDLLERTALVRTLGHSRRPQVAGPLLRAGAEALRKEDGDLLVPMLAALARLPRGPQTEEVRRFAERVRERVHGGRGFRAERGMTGVQPDRPDPARTRAEILEQLALLVEFRQAPHDGRLLRELLGYAAPEPAPLGTLHQRVRPLYLEALQLAGEQGMAMLETTARARGLDLELRRRALQLLPITARDATALELLATPEEDPLQRALAFELLLADRHPSARDLAARRLLDVRADTGPLGLAQRYALTLAVRFLEREGVLTAALLEPLVAHLVGDAATPPALELWLAESLDELLVSLADKGSGARRTRKAVKAWLGTCEERGLEGALGHLDPTLALVVAIAEGAPGAWADHMRAQLLARLQGREFLPAARAPVFAGPAAARFEPPVPLLRDVLLALGGTGEERAVERLGELTAKVRGEERELVALALGRSGLRSACEWLVPLLLDELGPVRFAANEALLYLGAPALDVDWLVGSTEERSRAAEERYRWYVQQRR